MPFKPSESHADRDPVSLTLTPPLRITALVLGALVLTGLAAVVFLARPGALGGEPTASPTPTPVTKPAPHAVTKPKRAATSRPARVATGFPPKVDHALRYGRVVVVSVSLPGAAVDAVVRTEARAAARAARAGFVAISASDERSISRLVAKSGVLPAPAVVIIKRPGLVAGVFSVTDAGTIQQAVAQARR